MTSSRAWMCLIGLYKGISAPRASQQPGKTQHSSWLSERNEAKPFLSSCQLRLVDMSVLLYVQCGVKGHHVCCVSNFLKLLLSASRR